MKRVSANAVDCKPHRWYHLALQAVTCGFFAGANVKYTVNRNLGGEHLISENSFWNVTSATLPNRLLRFSALGAVSMSMLLSGCSNSPTNAAAEKAASASSKAAHYVSTAGDYRPAANFPGQFNKPLTTSALRMREQSAMRNPAAYLAKNGSGFTSSKRDIRHAISLLTEAIGNPATTWEYKRVLYAQRALCEDQLAAMNAKAMQSEVALITRQLHALDYSTLHRTRYAKKINYLKAQRKAYGDQYVSALRAAKRHEQKVQEMAVALTTRLHHAQTALAALEAKRKNDLIRGGRLEMQSRIQTGEKSLSTLESGTRLLDAAARVSIPIELANLRIQRMQYALSLAQNRVAHAKAQVTELAAQRKIAEKIAHRAAEQLTLLQSAVHTIIYGASAKQMDVNHSASAIKALLAKLAKQAGKATTEYRAASQDFNMAINSQNTAYSAALKLINAKVHASDPMVQALQNKSPSALLQIFKSASTLSEAQMLRTELMAKMLQKSAAQLCQMTYKLIGKSSPIGAPKAGYIAALRKSVILKMDSATSSLSRAKMDAASSSSDIKWLAPAYRYAVNVAIAETATEPAMIAKAEKIAVQSAKKADSLKPSLNLPVSLKPM